MIYVCYRHGGRREFKCATFDEAIEHAAGDHESGEAAYFAILADDGTVLMDQDSMRQAVFDKCAEWDDRLKSAGSKPDEFGG
jgi:hypothetical protein